MRYNLLYRFSPDLLSAENEDCNLVFVCAQPGMTRLPFGV